MLAKSLKYAIEKGHRVSGSVLYTIFKLNKDSEELYCYYSGLPSVLVYQ